MRRDLHDEESGNYRWTDDELDRHAAHALKELSNSLPAEQKATLATAAGSREIDISSLTMRVNIEAVEYPVNRFPKKYQRFAVWGNVLTLLGAEIPDGSNAAVYYGKLHTLDASTSTVPAEYEDLVAAGAAGYAAVEAAIYAANRVNAGGNSVPADLHNWGEARLKYFREELRKLGRRNRVRARSLYGPHYPVVSKTTDFGP